MKQSKRRAFLLLLILGILGVHHIWKRSLRKTVADSVSEYGVAARSRLLPHLVRSGISWPPPEVTLVYFKNKRFLGLHISGKLVHSWPVLAASGGPGPKLKEGDRQVPEGVYRIEALNPNSRYHLSLRLNYPNQDDLRFADLDGRTQLDSDIMIHGKNVSIGCLAIGDSAIEELFVLAAESDLSTWKVVLAPVDLRRESFEVTGPPWKQELYQKIRSELDRL